METYGVIDLGSNSIRLVIYSLKNSKKNNYCSKDIKRVLNDKAMAGLAAYVTNNTFTQAGVDKAVSVLKSHIKHASYYNCKRLEVFATAVIRNASNCNSVLSEIKARTGLSISLLSAHDEAHLGFVGASLSNELSNGTLIDIGGGSTEITRINNGTDSKNISLPQGSLSSFSKYVSGIIPTNCEMKAIKTEFENHISKLQNPNVYKANVLYGIGGSARASTKIYQQLANLEKRPHEISHIQLQEVLKASSANPNAFSHTALKAVADRIHTIVPGCVILNTIFEKLEAEKLIVCKYGVREGYLLDRMLN